MDNKMGITIDTSIDLAAGEFDPIEEQESRDNSEDWRSSENWECFTVPTDDKERLKEFDEFCQVSFNAGDWSRLGAFLRFRNEEDSVLFYLTFTSTRD